MQIVQLLYAGLSLVSATQLVGLEAEPLPKAKVLFNGEFWGQTDENGLIDLPGTTQAGTLTVDEIKFNFLPRSVYETDPLWQAKTVNLCGFVKILDEHNN